MIIDWRRLTEADFPLLGEWLARPHVARWWNQESSLDAIQANFGPAARGEEPSEDLLALLDGRPIGLMQRYRLSSFPQHINELAPIIDVPPGAMSVDYLIGDLVNTGRGLGTCMIVSMIQRTWTDHADAACIIVPVVAANRASWRALEKAGLERIGEGNLEPDNPVDDPWHYIYRIDRP